jgi:phenylacetic acid degradation operon negative regulatory protein
MSTMVENGAVVAAEPTLSRRQAAGRPTARGLLFTVLGELVLPSGGTAWTAALIAVLGRLGIEEKAARQALMRTAADGWLTAERVGRQTRWRLTAAAERLLVDGTARIYGFTAGPPDWDGRWLVVLARAPETERPARHVLRTRLAWAGLGSPAPGVWITPHAERLGEVEAVLREAGVIEDAQVFAGPHAGGGDPRRLARQAWDLDAVEQQYEQFVAEFGPHPGADPLAATMELVHAWRRFPWTDPLLPAELLPDPWLGRTAAAVFADRHAAWSAAARAEWRRLAERAG